MLLITITRDSGNIYIRRNAAGTFDVLDGARLIPSMTAAEVAVYLRATDFPIEVL